MAQTKAGAAKARETNIKKYGPDYYQKLGAMGGKKGSKDGAIKGFAAFDRDKLLQVSSKGGRISRRGKIND